MATNNMYTQSITRSHRTAFMIAIDCSGSMAETISYLGRESTKAEVVANITNDLLFELIERARRYDGVRNYYDIAVMGYWGDDQVSSLLPSGQEIIAVSDLASTPPPLRTEMVEYRLPDGGIALRELKLPAWIKAKAQGQTPMCEALRRIRDLAADWCSRTENRDSFPPMIFNITDGEATDCDDQELMATCQQIRSLATTNGEVLLLNIHIAAGQGVTPIFFPEACEANYTNRYAGLLYECSSQMPSRFDAPIREAKGLSSMPPFRGMSFNASATQVVAMLNIGSISVKTE